jgi:hypothetical protein
MFGKKREFSPNLGGQLHSDFAVGNVGFGVGNVGVGNVGSVGKCQTD